MMRSTTFVNPKLNWVERPIGDTNEMWTKCSRLSIKRINRRMWIIVVWMNEYTRWSACMAWGWKNLIVVHMIKHYLLHLTQCCHSSTRERDMRQTDDHLLFCYFFCCVSFSASFLMCVWVRVQSFFLWTQGVQWLTLSNFPTINFVNWQPINFYQFVFHSSKF